MGEFSDPMILPWSRYGPPKNQRSKTPWSHIQWWHQSILSSIWVGWEIFYLWEGSITRGPISGVLGTMSRSANQIHICMCLCVCIFNWFMRFQWSPFHVWISTRLLKESKRLIDGERSFGDSPLCRLDQHPEVISPVPKPMWMKKSLLHAWSGVQFHH